MGTAGHIDHGKTTLVKALTGIDCDRLKEEKKRGITIELGFAFLDLPGSQRLGVIDVPGHERFVKNMVAGAGGIDFVMLVIAADEGVMPQTREHLEICTLLGVERGVVALTKVDAVDEELLMLVQEDVAEFMSGTFLEDAPVLPVSAHDGQGLDALKEELARLAAEFKPQRRADLLRLPVDRVFTLRGHGTVVTGTLISGSASVGEDVILFPGGTRTKVRGLQSHGDTVQTAESGRRTAVNLQGLEVDDISRGDVLAREGALFPSKVWDVELTYLPSAPRELKHRKELHFHHGTREVSARIYLHDRDALKPGDKALCRFLFSEPMVGVYGDRVVVRSFSPLRTIAGGKLVNPLGRKAKRFDEQGFAELAKLASSEPEEILEVQLKLAGTEGLTRAQMMILTNLESKELDALLQKMSSRGAALMFDKERRSYVSGAEAENIAEKVKAFLADFHAKNPMKEGAGRGELATSAAKGVPDKLFHMLMERMLKQGEIESSAEAIRLPGHTVSMASDQAKFKDEIVKAYEQGGETPPNLKDVLADLGVSRKEAQEVLSLLLREGKLVRVTDEIYYDAAAMNSLRDKVAGYLRENGEMGAPEFKEITGLSRKYAIPVMEHLDKEKLTLRVGDKRVLRRKD
jgi:selenocysteine-specific elongation factor